MMSQIETISDMIKDLKEREQDIKVNSDKIQKLHEKILGLIKVYKEDPIAKDKLERLFAAFPGGVFNEYKKLDKQAIQITKGLKSLYKQMEKTNKLAKKLGQQPTIQTPPPEVKKAKVKVKKVRSYL